MMEFLLLTEV